ncbi:hypothetical protein OKW49_006531 [Paraburkholderia youngii]
MSRGFRTCVKAALTQGFAANFHLSALSATSRQLPVHVVFCVFLLQSMATAFSTHCHTLAKSEVSRCPRKSQAMWLRAGGLLLGCAGHSAPETPGCRSVTNAAESVVAAALAVMDGPAPEVIVYRDSMGSSTGCSSARKTASPDISRWVAHVRMTKRVRDFHTHSRHYARTWAMPSHGGAACLQDSRLCGAPPKREPVRVLTG